MAKEPQAKPVADDAAQAAPTPPADTGPNLIRCIDMNALHAQAKAAEAGAVIPEDSNNG